MTFEYLCLDAIGSEQDLETLVGSFSLGKDWGRAILEKAPLLKLRVVKDARKRAAGVYLDDDDNDSSSSDTGDDLDPTAACRSTFSAVPCPLVHQQESDDEDSGNSAKASVRSKKRMLALADESDEEFAHTALKKTNGSQEEERSTCYKRTPGFRSCKSRKS
ncbi:hypothetical protein PC128_g1702 [Phytophthora cactorum]|nr:hypothetical protein PC128_g1702 [Phytophthora cactorum]